MFDFYFSVDLFTRILFYELKLRAGSDNVAVLIHSELLFCTVHLIMYPVYASKQLLVNFLLFLYINIKCVHCKKIQKCTFCSQK